MQERQLLCSQEEQIHAIPLFKFKQESIFLRLAKFPRLGFYHDEEMHSKKERDRFVRAAVYESTLPLLSNANVWFCPTSKVTEGAGADFLFDYPYSIQSTDGAKGVGRRVHL